MFRFNFEGEENATDTDENIHGSQTFREVGLIEAEEVIPSGNCEFTHARHLGPKLQVINICDELNLIKVAKTSEEASKSLVNDAVVVSDLVPGEYEGGFKLWEGGIDLAAYVHQHWKKDISSNSTVLELGCGHGLPGVVALLNDAEVHFADYNREVLIELTHPTVIANWNASKKRMKEESSNITRPPVRYFSGDWKDLSKFLKELGFFQAYDLILTAETVYTIEGTIKLIDCIKATMKRPSGKCLLASKVFYFGVGGGTESLFKLLDDHQELVYTVATTYDDKLSTKRQIIEIAWKGSE